MGKSVQGRPGDTNGPAAAVLLCQGRDIDGVSAVVNGPWPTHQHTSTLPNTFPKNKATITIPEQRKNRAI